MSEIDKAIKNIDKAIYNNIESLPNNRWLLAQNILSQLRNLLEHIFLKFYIDNIGKELDDNYENLKSAIKYVYSNEWKYKLFKRFHKSLQISVSHYTLDKENSERLMLNYLEYLYKIKKFLNDKYNLSILDNIEKFPTNINSSNRKYYENIVKKN